MAEITVPDDDALILGSLDLDTPAQVNRSGWTGSRKVVGLPGAERWYASVSIDVLATELDERPWRGFLFNLKGVQNFFRLKLGCQNHAGNRPTVRSGADAGHSLPLEGLAANTVVLTSGQFMTVPLPSGHHRLVCLSSDLVTNGQGQGTATFNPALGEVPALGAVVETKDPFVPVALAESRIGLNYENAIAGRSFAVEEAA